MKLQEEILKLKELIKQSDKKAFYNQIALLSDLVPKGNITEEINKLLTLVSKHCTAEEYMKQLDYIASFMDTKVDKYVPINETFQKEYTTKKKVKKGISFLCPEFDKRTGGMYAPSVSVIVGGSGCMKTTYAVNICYNALKEGKNVAYLSLEESPMQLYSKLLSRVSVDVGKPIPHQEIIQHKLSEQEQCFLFDEVQSYLEKLDGTLFVVGEADFINYDLFELEQKLKEIDWIMKEKSSKKQQENHGIDILVVDHIQLLKYAGDVKVEYSTINKYVSFFRQQSLSFLHQKREIVVILLSQVNREGLEYAKKDNKKHSKGEYLIQHIGEASEIERSASYIITVYSDSEDQISNLLRIGALKLRGSALLNYTINIFANGEYYQVGDVPIQEFQEYSMDEIITATVSADNKSPVNILEEYTV